MKALKPLLIIALFALFSASTFAATTDLHVKEWYPKNNHYIFICDNDFNATSFDFQYGDGHKLLGLQQNDNYHVFERAGTYAVECTAHSSTESASDTLTVTVGSIRVPSEQPVDPTPNSTLNLHVKEWYPQGNDYIFVCGEGGADSYDFYFGDGQKNAGRSSHEVFYRYTTPGTYTVECVAHLGGGTQSDTLLVTINPVDITGEQAPPSNSTCLLDAQASVDAGWIEYDRLVGDERHLVWAEEGRMKINWFTATRDGQLLFTESWNNGDFDHTPASDLCIGTACVGSSANSTQVNSTCAAAEPSLDIRLYPGFPQDHKTAIECVASGFTPDEYEWSFGDGETQATSDYDAYHIYDAEGTYEVSCSADNMTATMNVVIDTPFPTQLIGGENTHINSTLSVGGNSGDQWGVYLELIEQNGNDFTVHCGEIGHTTDYQTYWQIPPELEVLTTSEDTETKVLRATESGVYQIMCSQGVREPVFYYLFWEPGNPLYHNGIPGFGYGPDRALTGYGVTLDVHVTDENACYPGLAALTAHCDQGDGAGGFGPATITGDQIEGNCRTIQCAGGSATATFTACEQQDGDSYKYIVNSTAWSGGTGLRGCFDNVCFDIEGRRCEGDHCWVRPGPKESPQLPVCGPEDIPVDFTAAGARTVPPQYPTGESIFAVGSVIEEVMGSVENIGTEDITATWKNAYYLSLDETLSEDDYLILEAEDTALVWGNGGDEQQSSLNVPLPDVPVGDYHLIFVVDTENTIVESNETNNIAATYSISIYDPNACYVSVRHLEASCENGHLIGDSWDGTCRNIYCTDGPNEMFVTACDQQNGTVRWFEMERTGDTVFEFCLGDVCFGENDSVRSEDFVCA